MKNVAVKDVTVLLETCDDACNGGNSIKVFCVKRKFHVTHAYSWRDDDGENCSNDSWKFSECNCNQGETEVPTAVSEAIKKALPTGVVPDNIVVARGSVRSKNKIDDHHYDNRF